MKNEFFQGTKFFFTDFHKGTVNIILHLISITVLAIGVIQQNIILFVVGIAVIDEMGHIYNYLIAQNKNTQYNPIRMIPFQIIYIGPISLAIFIYLSNS